MAVESLRPLERPPWCTAANIRRERGQVQKGDASGDCKLRLTAIMLRRGYAVHEAADEGWLRASIRLQGAGAKRPSQRFGLRESAFPRLLSPLMAGIAKRCALTFISSSPRALWPGLAFGRAGRGCGTGRSQSWMRRIGGWQSIDALIAAIVLPALTATDGLS